MKKNKQTGKNSESKSGRTRRERFRVFKSLASFMRDERFAVALGVLFIAFSILLTLSFTSYLFTWKSDQSLLHVPFQKMISDDSIVVENWVGKLGAMLSNVFIRNWFGLASFSFVAIFGLIGFRLLKVRLLPLRKSVFMLMIITIWLSITLAYFFSDKLFYLGGAHGYFVCKWLNGLWGKVGTLAFIGVGAFVIVIYSFKNALASFKSWFAKLAALKKEDLTENDSGFAGDINNEDAETESEVKESTEELSEETQVEKEFVVHGEEIDLPVEITEQVIEKGSLFDDIELELQETESEELISDEEIDEEPMGDYDPTEDLKYYKKPGIDLLVELPPSKNEVSASELNSNKDRIVKTLLDYKIEISKISATIGPTVTLYEIVPAPGVRISKIKNLEDDIALSLAALGIRIIAPMPGKGTIGIEVPNSNPEIVSMRSVIKSAKFQESTFQLPVAIGKTISNETFVFNLAKTPHLLVAGATGQGKSVGINAIITSLLYKKHPSQIKFVLIDPKMVELSLYSKIERHFLAKLPNEESAIITNVEKVVPVMNSLCIEMEDRYKLLTQAGVRNIVEYNEKFISRKLNPYKGHKYLPYIVVIVDEFADIIIQEGKQVEAPISRLAAKARAIGIHLIVATQRPSVDVITGVIKANFPTRIAFKVMSGHDSKTIIDATGANQLIGKGDMLMVETGKAVRIQCAFIDTPEVESIVDFIGKQQGYGGAFELPDPGVDGGEGSDFSFSSDEKDPLFDEAARLIVRHQQGSTSLIQRKMKIGYNRAGRIIDQLEHFGIVGPYEGSKARQVLFSDEYSLEQFLKNSENKTQ
ncbi:MAG TPA: DNA translocase FtsK 4TM domain-containing protein [Bacteroidales bacterium]|nr:DNA translocase FtsK 4TM domain-containing protein [Bacteroidales bacterium]